MRKLYFFLSFVIILLTTTVSVAQIPYDRPCYGVNAGLDSTFCSSSCKAVSRLAIPDHENRSTTAYVVQQLTMPAPAYNTSGTNTIVDQDDIWSGVVGLGFNFCFFGNTYNSIVIGANGLISFNTAYAGLSCPWSYTGGLPLCCTTGNRLNTIMGPYTDIDPSVGFNPNRINWYREGVAPCRRFVINFYQVPYFWCTGTIMSSQIILHEAYNIIDVVIASKPVCSAWNSGQGLIGIQDATGANWYAPAGSNPSTVPQANICYRFLPNGPLMQTINWTQGATVVSNTATLNPTICPTSTTTYVANLVNTRCDGTTVTVTDAVNFTVNAAPAPSAGPDKAINCTSSSVTLGSPTVAGHTYLWTPSAGLSATNIAQPTATAANTYYLTETNTASGCITKDTVIVISDFVPPVANAGPDKALTCGAVTIGTAAVAGYTYSWTPAAGLNDPTLAQPTASSPNVYTLTVTNLVNGCTASDAVTVSGSITLPTANAGPDKMLTCTAPSVTIGSPAVAGNTYSWSPAIGLNNAAIAQPTASAPNTYILTVTQTAGGCTVKDTVVISQDIVPPVANAGADQVLTCTNSNYVIGTAAIAGTGYSWSPAAGLSNASIAQPTVTAPNVYTLTATNLANGCTTTDAVTISQNITPPAANAGADQTLTCTAPVVTIGSAAVAGNIYSWSPAAGLSNASIAQPTTTAPNIYTLTVTNTANGCTATDAVTILQNTTPPVANAGADQALTCTNLSYVIGTPAVAGDTYSWSPAAGLSNASIAQPTVTASNIYTLTVTNTANGCTATDAVTISQNITPPVANAGADQTLTCTNPNYVIGAAAVAGNTYSWSPAAGLSNAAIAQPTATAPNIYTLTVTNTANGCTSADAVTILQNITPPAANAGVDQTLTCTTPVVTIGSAAVAGNTYSWSPAGGLS
ncbi:MAG: hypothetical protein JWN78_2112, partial [Bacteroidota bacterium]|nr:hypothetical protein [Bacteroidota bacterium]